MARHHQLKRPPLLRFTAGLGALLVFMLAVLAVSPNLHAWLHAEDSAHAPASTSDHPGDDTDSTCVITQFSHGSSELAVAPALLPAQPLALVGATPLVPDFRAPSAPAHTLPPGCGPPTI